MNNIKTVNGFSSSVSAESNGPWIWYVSAILSLFLFSIFVVQTVWGRDQATVLNRIQGLNFDPNRGSGLNVLDCGRGGCLLE